MIKKILILGGNGFVGKNVVEVLKNTTMQLFVASRANGLDLTDYQSTKDAFKQYQPDIIINCAAKVGSLNYVTQQAALVFDENMRMLLNIYKAINEICPTAVLINPIANCAFPGNIDEYSEDKFWNGKVHQSVMAYGNTRRMIEVLTDCYRMQYSLKVINLIVPNMYGRYDSTDPNKAHALNALVSKAVKAKRENIKSLEIWGSGIAIREWLFAEDFGRIIFEILNDIEKFSYKEPFNIAQNYGLSIRELLEIIISKGDYTGEIIWNKAMPDGAQRKVMNEVRFRKLFPDFAFTNLEIGIQKTLEYYNSIYPY